LGFVWLVVRRRKRLSPIDFTNWKKDSEFGDDDWRLLLAFGRRSPSSQGISSPKATAQEHFPSKIRQGGPEGHRRARATANQILLSTGGAAAFRAVDGPATIMAEPVLGSGIPNIPRWPVDQ